jgi:ribosomal protein L37AE/L43A
MIKMVRKKNCPNCGSRKITLKGNEWKCNICGAEFSGKSRGRTSKKGKKQW